MFHLHLLHLTTTKNSSTCHSTWLFTSESGELFYPLSQPPPPSFSYHFEKQAAEPDSPSWQWRMLWTHFAVLMDFCSVALAHPHALRVSLPLLLLLSPPRKAGGGGLCPQSWLLRSSCSFLPALLNSHTPRALRVAVGTIIAIWG